MSAILLSIFLSTVDICRCTSILGNVKLRFPISLGLIDGYDDLIVKEKMIVARDSAPTRYSALLLSDLP